MQIISLTSFWCTHSSSDNLLKLSLILPQSIDDLSLQVSDRAPPPLPLGLVITTGIENLVGDAQNTVPVPLLMYGREFD
jgi:hypothetical protein